MKSYKMSNHAEFEEKGFLVLPEFLSNSSDFFTAISEDTKLLSYSKKQWKVLLDEDPFVPGSITRIHDPRFSDLFFEVEKRIEKLLDMDLETSYYLNRTFLVRQKLQKNIETGGNEVCVNIQLNSNSTRSWPLWVEKPTGRLEKIYLKTGDAIVYKGNEISCWRDPLEFNEEENPNTFNQQVYFYYVNPNGPYIEFAGDYYRSLR